MDEFEKCLTGDYRLDWMQTSGEQRRDGYEVTCVSRGGKFATKVSKREKQEGMGIE